MADIVQVAFSIPPSIQQGIDAGNLFRYGGVIRDATGQIVAHLKEAPLEGIEEGTNRFIELVKKNKFFIGTVVVASVTSIVYLLVKNKNNKSIKIPKCVVDFNNSFVNYLDSIKSGSVSEEKLDDVISSLEIITKNQEDGYVSIDLSLENTSLLIDMIREYTMQLATANSYAGQVDAPANMSGLNSLRHYLNIQKQIFAKCA